MLQYIQQRTSSLGVKIILGLIVVSFASVGVVGLFNSGLMSRYLVSVGSEQVTIDEFSKSLSEIKRRIEDQTKQKVDLETLKKMGFYDRLIGQLTGEAALRQEISDFSIVAPDKSVRDTIHLNPAFQGDDGRFTPQILKKTLEQQGLTENTYIQMVRKSLMKAQLLQPVVSGAPIPQGYIDTIFKASFQKRSFATVKIPFSAIPIKAADVTDPQLKGFYEKNRQAFLVPETRSFELLYLTSQMGRDQYKISEEDVKAAYETGISEFTIEEKRRILEFKSMDDELLTRAVADLNKGMLFTQVVKKYNLQYVDLGLITAAQAPENVAEIAFDLPLNTPCDLYKDSNEWKFAFVTKIEPEKILPYAQVSAQIRDNLIDEKLNQHIESISEKIEDAIASGESFESVAKEFKLKYVVVDHTLQNGYLKNSFSKGDSMPVMALPAGLDDELKQSLILEIFQTSVGKETSLQMGPKSCLAIAKVTNSQESYVPRFEDIKEQVLGLYKKNKQFEVAARIANEITASVNNVQDLKNKASINNYEFKIHEPFNLTRAESDKVIQKDFAGVGLQNIFFLKKGKTAYYPIMGHILIVHVQDVLPFNKDDFAEQLNQFEMNFQFNRTQEIEVAYIRSLLSRFKVKENASAIESIKN